MKQAVIDIGSNSMRVTVYEIEHNSFRVLFKEKIMAGLAGYVEDGYLKQEGIETAYNGLLEFKEILEALEISLVSVFATASLRNISNTDEAIAEICAATGMPIEIISGKDEAAYGYAGAMNELSVSNGIFTDIGGASTEIAVFSDGNLLNAESFKIGSLKLYCDCVKHILPGKKSANAIRKIISNEIDCFEFADFEQRGELICVGGTARATLKIAKKMFSLPSDSISMTSEQLMEICQILCSDKDMAASIILRLEPERIHTIIPGMLILEQIARKFKSEQITVSKYGVREGFLCQRILSKI